MVHYEARPAISYARGFRLLAIRYSKFNVIFFFSRINYLCIELSLSVITLFILISSITKKCSRLIIIPEYEKSPDESSIVQLSLTIH